MKKDGILRIQAKDLKKKKVISKKIVKHFNDKGIIVIENILSKPKCNFYINLLEKVYKKLNNRNSLNSKENKNNVAAYSQQFHAKSLSNLHNKHIKFLGFIDYPLVLNLVSRFLQQGSYMNSDNIICQQIAARSTTGKAEAQQLHNDSRIVGSLYPIVVQVMWALDPFTKNNGATRFVVGSHKLKKFPQNKKVYKGEKIMEVPQGSAIIFDGAVWHGSSKTKALQNRRWAMICRYARWFIKPSFDFMRNTPIHIYNKMNKSQRDLLGFRFNPPIDEFSGLATKQNRHQKPYNYKLPL